MRLPWVRTEQDWERSDKAVREVRSHLRVLVHELEQITARIEAKAGDMAHER
jgi:hypothetical protein